MRSLTAAGLIWSSLCCSASFAAPIDSTGSSSSLAAEAPSLKIAEPAGASRVISAPKAAMARVSQDPSPTLHPSSFVATLQVADTYLRIDEAGGWPALMPGRDMKEGERGPLVALLRKRLAVAGDLPAAEEAGDVFDETLTRAVKRFQMRHGLPETGLVGPLTVKAMNVPAATRFRQLTASAQRLAGSAFPFGERYVVVNIPAASVEAVENGAVARRFTAVVGRPERASPTIEARIQTVNLNPTWTVPVSIVKSDIIPAVRKDPAYLEKAKMRILDGQGQEVDPASLDWSSLKPAAYLFRQDASAKNSLGQVRIDMPNKLAVYMHDTPAKGLFARSDRFHSSGCVRVEDVVGFAEWLLEGAPGGWTRPVLEAGIAIGLRKDVRLPKAIPVAWVYMTGWASADGTAHFRDDVYGIDAPKPVAEAAPVPPRRTN